MWSVTADFYRRAMGTRVLALSICTAALLLSTCTTGAAEPVPAPTGAVARADTVQGDLDGMIRSGAVGALATLTDNGTTTVRAAGNANLAAATPMPADPPQHVRVGSITKTCTAAVILQLAAEGRADLDRPIDTYLPGLLTGDGIDGRVITVRQILGHRSGLPEPTEALGVNEHTAAQLGRTFTPAQEIALAMR